MAQGSHGSSVEWAASGSVHTAVGLSSHHSIMHGSGLDPDDTNYEDNEYDTYAGTTHSYSMSRPRVGEVHVRLILLQTLAM